MTMNYIHSIPWIPPQKTVQFRNVWDWMFIASSFCLISPKAWLDKLYCLNFSALDLIFCFRQHNCESVDCLGANWKLSVTLKCLSVAVLKGLIYSHNHSGSKFIAGWSILYYTDNKFISYLNLNCSKVTFIT